MVDPIHSLCLAVGADFLGVHGTLTPKSGSGPIRCTALVIPRASDEIAARLGMLGVERPGYDLVFLTDEVLLKPEPGDRFAEDDDGLIYELRGVASDFLGARWNCSGCVVAPEIVITGEGFMLPFYFAGIEAVGL